MDGWIEVVKRKKEERMSTFHYLSFIHLFILHKLNSLVDLLVRLYSPPPLSIASNLIKAKLSTFHNPILTAILPPICLKGNDMDIIPHLHFHA